jgi:hypothetical protein
VNWDVQVYGSSQSGDLIEREAREINRNEDMQFHMAWIVRWLKKVRAGETSPEDEPNIPGPNSRKLRYRCEGSVVLIFGLVDQPPRLVILRIAQGASAYPRTEDCIEAERRWDEHQSR